MASWKIVSSSSQETQFNYTSFHKCRKFFAVDDSGSTAGAVLRQERAFVDAFRESHRNAADAISLWGSDCDKPTKQFDSIQWRANHAGTYPGSILQNSSALRAIKRSDVWFLLTDGEIYDASVLRLANQAFELGVLNVPLIFVVTGSRGSSPGTANISVGISFFASSEDTLILFKETETGKIYVIAGNGCFAELGGSAEAQDLTKWSELLMFKDEAEFFSHCKKINIQLIKSEKREESNGAISLGSVWEQQHHGRVRVDLESLLRSGVLADADAVQLLTEEAFAALAIACKTRGRLSELREFLQVQKVEEVVPKLEDRHGAAGIIAKMTNATISNEDRRRLQEQLRDAHTANRREYQKRISELASSAAAQALRERNRLVDAALRSIASIEAASYNAELISRRSNRARRADVIESSVIDVAELDLEAPSYKDYCLICCGEQEIMSICFKEVDAENAEDNTSDFALNFPLAAGASPKNISLVSSQNVCFQCALGLENKSIYNERLTAIVPTVQYDGSNKKYINNQLYSALTARLDTGAAGVAQLFMSILQNVMETKSWAGAGMGASQPSADEHNEARQRREMFQWMLDQFLQNTQTRETFSEVGEWVKFPQALSWVAKDFESNGLASFAVTYPAAGFDGLLAFGQRSGAFSEAIAAQLKTSKVLYCIAAKYLAELQTALQTRAVDGNNLSEAWKQKHLEVIYHDFNGPLVPVYQGETSILDDTEIFKQRLSACLTTTAEVEPETDTASMHKVQILLFWLLYTQRNHCTAQTLFTQLHHSQPLAPAVLNPTLTVPTSSRHQILLSLFAQHDASPINPSLAASHNGPIPFANPFGPSVLQCGDPNCTISFYTDTTAPLNPSTLTPTTITAIRNARTDHLIDVFGIRGRFEDSATGLPERHTAGRAPTSTHMNLHMSIVREWAATSYATRQEIVSNSPARRAFATRVQSRLCVDGRGDIFSAGVAAGVEAVLPSFFEVLADALRRDGRGGEHVVDVAEYVHDFERNGVQDKILFELAQGASVL